MIRCPNRFAGITPLLTHRTIVAGDTSSSTATSFVVMYFVIKISSPQSIYKTCALRESNAFDDARSSVPACPCPLVCEDARPSFHLRIEVPDEFPFPAQATSSESMGYRTVSKVSIFLEELTKKNLTTFIPTSRNSSGKMETSETYAEGL